MKRIVMDVSCCDNCPFSATSGEGVYFCECVGAPTEEDGSAPPIDDGDTIPEWCPLPDKPKKGENDGR